MKYFLNLCLISLLSTVIASCSGSTHIVNSWKAPDAQLNKSDLDKVMVAVLSTNEATRRIAEDQLAAKNPGLSPSYKIITSEALARNVEESKQQLSAAGFDGVLIFRFLDTQESSSYVPPSYAGPGYWGYHRGYWGNYYDPGYYREDTEYIVESTLFSLEQDKLLWSGITSTLNPDRLDEMVNEIADEVYRQMVADGLF